MLITPLLVLSASSNIKVSGHRDGLIFRHVSFAYDLDFCSPMTDSSAPESIHAPSNLFAQYISFPRSNFFKFRAYSVKSV